MATDIIGRSLTYNEMFWFGIVGFYALTIACALVFGLRDSRSR